MLFELANALRFFKVNSTFHEMLNVFSTTHIDDNLIYSDSKKEHCEYVRKARETIGRADLQADIDGCFAHVPQLTNLGLIFTNMGIRMNPQKVEVVQK